MLPSELSVTELLTTTRAVRKRLNLEKSVAPELIEECMKTALQAPTGGNAQSWQFIVVYDSAKRKALGDLYKQAWEIYRESSGSVFDLADTETKGARKDQLHRVAKSGDYLADNLGKVPVHLIPIVRGRVEKLGGSYASVGLASIYGSILPATWSFMLAARTLGLGTCWTTAHLMYEQEAADILGIPFDKFTQVALIPTAYSVGNTFKVSLRKSIDDVMHVDTWCANPEN